MNNFNLSIAGYNIGFESGVDGPDLKPSSKCHAFITDNKASDVIIRVHSGIMEMPAGAKRIFNAPYVEEVNGIHYTVETHFWSIWKHNSDLYIKTIFPLSKPGKNATLRFSLASTNWNLWINAIENEVDPFDYPLDGLLLYYLTVINGDIMIHASGVNYDNKGYLFSGISGKGKSTIAKIWESCGAKVIHDDRLIIRKQSDGYKFFNTPVYNNDEPNESVLNKIFIIQHGENLEKSLEGAHAVTAVLANCIQHNWGADIVTRQLGNISVMCLTIPVSALSFRPEISIFNYILENE